MNTPSVEEKIWRWRDLANMSSGKLRQDMLTMFSQMSRRMGAPDEAKDVISKVTDSVNFEEMDERINAIIAEQFSDEELDHMIEELMSPVGKAIAEKMNRFGSMYSTIIGAAVADAFKKATGEDWRD